MLRSLLFAGVFLTILTAATPVALIARTVTWSIVTSETIQYTACRRNLPNCNTVVGMAITRPHGRCTILTPPPTRETLWIIQHELRHCAGWTHK